MASRPDQQTPPPAARPLIIIRISRNAVFTVVAVVLGLLVLEGLARGLVFAKRKLIDPRVIECEDPYSTLCPYTREWDTEQGDAQRLDLLTGTAWTPGYQGEWITINSMGLRGGETTAEKPTGTLRIAMLGGSAVVGAGVHNEESIPAYLETLIRDATDCSVEVINAGMSGFTTTQELIQLQIKILPLKPDIVIFYDGRNDAYFATSPRWDPVYSPPLQLYNEGINTKQSARLIPRAWGWLRQHSTLASLTAQAVFAIRGTGQGGLTDEQIDQLTMHPEVVTVYADNLRTMAQIAQWHGIQPVIVVQPLLGAGNKPLSDDEEQILAIKREAGYPDLVLEIYPDMAQAALEVGEEMGILALDYSGVFDGVGETVYSDDVHLRARGNEIVAEHLVVDLAPVLAEVGCGP